VIPRCPPNSTGLWSKETVNGCHSPRLGSSRATRWRSWGGTLLPARSRGIHYVRRSRGPADEHGEDSPRGRMQLPTQAWASIGRWAERVELYHHQPERGVGLRAHVGKDALQQLHILRTEQSVRRMNTNGSSSSICSATDRRGSMASRKTRSAARRRHKRWTSWRASSLNGRHRTHRSAAIASPCLQIQSCQSSREVGPAPMLHVSHSHGITVHELPRHPTFVSGPSYSCNHDWRQWSSAQ